MVGFKVGSGGNKIKRKDRKANTFKGRNVKNKAVWNYAWTWVAVKQWYP